jgi:hypothetical protein
MLSVYALETSRFAGGSNVTVFASAFHDASPRSLFGSLVTVTLAASIFSLKVNLMSAFTAMLEAPLLGMLEVRVGAVVSVLPGSLISS